MIIHIGTKTIDTDKQGWAKDLTDAEHDRCCDELDEWAYNNPTHDSACLCDQCLAEEQKQDELLERRESSRYEHD